MSRSIPAWLRPGIIERAPRAWQRGVLVFVALMLMVGWGVVVDKTWGAEAPSPSSSPSSVAPNVVPVPPGGHRQHHHLRKDTKLVKASIHLRTHVVSYHTLDKHGNPVPHSVRGHLICPRGWYASYSKYGGMFCQNYKEDRKMTKAAIKCAGDVAIGYVFGKLPGAGAGIAECAWSGLMR